MGWQMGVCSMGLNRGWCVGLLDPMERCCVFDLIHTHTRREGQQYNTSSLLPSFVCFWGFFAFLNYVI